jgi:hypothetical protein
MCGIRLLTDPVGRIGDGLLRENVTGLLLYGSVRFRGIEMMAGDDMKAGDKLCGLELRSRPKTSYVCLCLQCINNRLIWSSCMA